MMETGSPYSELPRRSVEADAVVLTEGDDSGVMLILEEGVVEVLKGDVQVSVAEDPGAFFGEMSVLLGRPHSATVRALTPARFIVIERPQEFLRDHPEIALSLARLLARRLHAMTTYLADIKRQFSEQAGSLAIIDEVLDALSHDQDQGESVLSDRDPDTAID